MRTASEDTAIRPPDTPPAAKGGRVRVLQFVTSFLAGGTERHVANLVQAHDRGRFEFHVGCLSASGALLPKLGDSAHRVSEYPIRRLYGPRTWRQQTRLARYLRRNRIQVLHAYGFYANCFAIPAAALARVPVIIGSVRDIGAGWTPRQRRLERWVSALSHAVLVNAEAVKRELVRIGYPADKITVIHNGIDVDAFAQAQQEPCLRRDLGIPLQAPLVGVVSRIDRVKGLEHFVDAAAIVSRRFGDCRFVLIGESYPTEEHQTYHRTLRRRVQDAGLEERVLFAGHRSDIAEVLSELDVSVLPSLTEGLSNVVLESMAAGAPVVATDVGGTSEMVDNGVNGLLVRPGDAQQLATAIETLLADPTMARQLARRARDTVDARFSIERMVRSTEQQYLDLLGPGRAREGRK